MYICNTLTKRNMKKLILSITLMLVTATAFAQTEAQADSLPPVSLDGYKDFDGFILDMGSMMATPPRLVPPQLSYQPYSSQTAPNYYELFRPDRGITYDRGAYYYNVSGPLSHRNLTLQSATFRLKNGMRITTLGEYDADGNKVRNPAALPWERNNFNGAFEFKSENGNFGIRIGVHRGRDTAY